ncbi:TIGR02186 family protein [Holosporaceae bacterium 'Namur']|nr:TIGR02186 family protein [Holosporaceae bacterium 'Namur']
MRRLLFSLGIIILSLSIGVKANAGYLIADLSTKNIILNYDFKGQYITISGISTGVEEIIISVDGPVRAYRVWKKEKINGVWINAKSFTIPSEHSYFFLASTKDLYSIADLDTLRDLALDYQFENYQVQERYPQLQFDQFKEEFKLYRQALKLYPTKVESIERIGENIFRAKFYIPNYAYSGKYDVSIYAFTKGKEVNNIHLSFEVGKQGLYAAIDEISKREPLKYAVYAILIALSAGLIAGFLFRKDR